MKTVDGRLIVVSGSSRCGKSTQVAKQVKAEKRLVVWDPEAQWCDQPGFRKVTNRDQVLAAIKTPGHLRIAYVTGGELKEEFNYLCKCVMYAGRFVAPLVFVAEELADVTTTSKAPAEWGILVRRGLKRGITIYAISQRWAEADKTAMGNVSEFLCFMPRPTDLEYVSKKTGLSVLELDSLKPFEFIQYDPVTKEKHRKTLRFRD